MSANDFRKEMDQIIPDLKASIASEKAISAIVRKMAESYGNPHPLPDWVINDVLQKHHLPTY